MHTVCLHAIVSYRMAQTKDTFRFSTRVQNSVWMVGIKNTPVWGNSQIVSRTLYSCLVQKTLLSRSAASHNVEVCSWWSCRQRTEWFVWRLYFVFLWYRDIWSFGDEGSLSTFFKEDPGTGTLYQRQRDYKGEESQLPSSKDLSPQLETELTMSFINRSSIWAVGQRQTSILGFCGFTVRGMNSTTTPMAKQVPQCFLRF